MDVVFGVYNGYTSVTTEKGGIYYFAKSLRKHNKDCKVIVLCEGHRIFKELEDLCHIHNFEIYSDFKFTYDLMLQRFEIYRDLLTGRFSQGTDKVLLCDFDDAVFQSDPFSIKFSEQLYCAAEKNTMYNPHSDSSGLNRYWIEKTSVAADRHLGEIEDCPIVCAGTILGKYDGVMGWLDFCADLQRRRPGSKDIFDQGLYNIYINSYTPADFKKILPYKVSQILTLDHVNFEELNIKDGKVVNDLGELYAIIHQINRCNPDFMKGLAE